MYKSLYSPLCVLICLPSIPLSPPFTHVFLFLLCLTSMDSWNNWVSLCWISLLAVSALESRPLFPHVSGVDVERAGLSIAHCRAQTVTKTSRFSLGPSSERHFPKAQSVVFRLQPVWCFRDCLRSAVSDEGDVSLRDLHLTIINREPSP